METTPQNTGEKSSSESQKLDPWDEMVRKVQFAGGEKIEKKFYESNIEFTGDDFNKFREELFNASPEDAKK